MSPRADCAAVERDPARVGGVRVFRGTRIPVAALFGNLRDGATIGQFPEWFPGIERWQVESVPDHEIGILTEGANRHPRLPPLPQTLTAAVRLPPRRHESAPHRSGCPERGGRTSSFSPPRSLRCPAYRFPKSAPKGPTAGGRP